MVSYMFLLLRNHLKQLPIDGKLVNDIKKIK